jgi:type VI secretion system protein ImpH
MAAPLRRQKQVIIDKLFAEPHNFEFHQAVRLIECMKPGAVPLGEGIDPGREALRIKAHVTFGFPASEIEALENKRLSTTLFINFVSIGSRQGPLAETYSETLIERAREKDTGFRDFLDIFNHRLASLWYRLRKKSLLGLVQTAPGNSPLGKTILHTSGASNAHLLKKSPLGIDFFIAAQRLLWPSVRSKEGLKVMLENYFKEKVNLVEFQGGWNYAREEDITRIGNKSGQHNKLGATTVVGNKSWQQDKSVIIEVGPVSWEKYQQLVVFKNSSEFLTLKEAIYVYLGRMMEVTLNIKLKAKETQPVKLSNPYLLGQSTWLNCDKKDTLSPHYYLKIKHNRL